MTVNSPIGVGWSAVPDDMGVLATGRPSANKVARCLSIETMMCRTPFGGGGAWSAAFDDLRAPDSVFSSDRERDLAKFPRAGLDGEMACVPHQDRALPFQAKTS